MSRAKAAVLEQHPEAECIRVLGRWQIHVGADDSDEFTHCLGDSAVSEDYAWIDAAHELGLHDDGPDANEENLNWRGSIA